MTYFDIFNGDADGLCALHQLRLADPRPSVKITGVKRDTVLVERAPAAAGDQLTVLDIGLDQNRAGLNKALEAGASCRYFDHHFAGEIPEHPALRVHIRTDPDVCTSLLVDEYLEGEYRLWAITAAFGDGLTPVAEQLCRDFGLNDPDREALRELGEALNYNAYGESLEDLHFHPAALYERVQTFLDPRDFARDDPAFAQLRAGYRKDLQFASRQSPMLATAAHFALALPNEAWTRRINGVLANRLAQEHPRRAHAILIPKQGGYLVSVRAPAGNPKGADAFCRKFPTGGGRSGAGGINLLPSAELKRFLAEFEAAF
ncbi:MAG: acetyltransferase [Betaproteobacteria bacterium]|nr:acetyltransferase [Betaproteobacteria bacterium]